MTARDFVYDEWKTHKKGSEWMVDGDDDEDLQPDEPTGMHMCMMCTYTHIGIVNCGW
jgi:hypothetical protein